MTSHLTLF